MSAEPTIPAGMVRWPGGAFGCKSPADWSGGKVLRRDGTINNADAWYWGSHFHGTSIANDDIIAYVPTPTSPTCEECGDTSPLAECGTCGRNTPTAEGEATREAVEEAVHRAIIRWSNGDQPKPLKAMVADAILALSAHNETDKLREALWKNQALLEAIDRTSATDLNGVRQQIVANRAALSSNRSGKQ